MKKLVVIGLVIAGGMVVSCEKQEFKPGNCNKQEVPSWEERKSIVPSASTPGTETNGNSGGITDPNSDEDGNGRKKV